MNADATRVAGVTLVPGTPEEPLEDAVMVLKLWRTLRQCTTLGRGSGHGRSMASIHIVKPGCAGYVVEQLVPCAEVLPHTIQSCVASIAHLMGVSRVYVNADLESLPVPDDRAAWKRTADEDVRLGLAHPQ